MRCGWAATAGWRCEGKTRAVQPLLRVMVKAYLRGVIHDG